MRHLPLTSGALQQRIHIRPQCPPRLLRDLVRDLEPSNSCNNIAKTIYIWVGTSTCGELAFRRLARQRAQVVGKGL